MRTESGRAPPHHPSCGHPLPVGRGEDPGEEVPPFVMRHPSVINQRSHGHTEKVRRHVRGPSISNKNASPTAGAGSISVEGGGVVRYQAVPLDV